MVKLLIGRKGSGKTKSMIQIANDRVEKSDGSVIFINKNHRLMYDLKYKIRVVCMEEYEQIKNSDEYIGFLYGILSSDHDIEVIFIDSILKHDDVNISNLPVFLSRLREISEKYSIEFIVSISATAEELGDITTQYEILN